MAFDFKRLLGKRDDSEEFISIDFDESKSRKQKILVRPFVIKQYDDVNEVLNALREGYTIAIIDIKPIKTKDVIELKRAISKIKKTIEAMEGSIAGFGDHTIIATPDFADIFKAPPQKEQKKDNLSFY